VIVTGRRYGGIAVRWTVSLKETIAFCAHDSHSSCNRCYAFLAAGYTFSGCEFMNEYVLLCLIIWIHLLSVTYHHDSSGHYSWLDHMFIDKRLHDDKRKPRYSVWSQYSMSYHVATMTRIPFDVPCNPDSVLRITLFCCYYLSHSYSI